MIFKILILLTSICYEIHGDEFRLPQTVFPREYKLNVLTDPEKSYFYGNVAIKLYVPSNSEQEIKLHMDPNFISPINITLNATRSCIIKAMNMNTSICNIVCGVPITTNSTLKISYMGNFNMDMEGLYKSVYEERSTKILLATQFEEMSARKAFPCFDEPIFKAAFQISITAPIKYQTVLSNTKKIAMVDNNKWRTHIFEKTPVMSSYLVGMVISQFDCVENKNVSSYNLTVCYKPSASAYVKTTLNYAKKCFDLLGEFTNISYPQLGNPKIHLVGIPDFAAGAMENWGLLTFREKVIFDEGEDTTVKGKQSIISSVCHEVAHQWFGDYVTIKWWSSMWLNEGFANYMDCFIPAQMKENFETDKQFVVNQMQYIMVTDEMPSAVPLYSKVQSEASGADKMTLSTYMKGASILRMLHFVMGSNNFRNGLRSYLNKFKYGNVDEADFLQIMNDFSNVNLSIYMNSWIKSPGFPLITAKLENKEITLSQERYLPSSKNPPKENPQWYIPLTYTQGGYGKSFAISSIQTWMVPGEEYKIKFDSKEWIIFNLQESGFYRVNYDDEVWRRIAKALKRKHFDGIHVLNRAQILDDVFSLAKFGRVNYSLAFTISEYLKKETEYYPWASMSRALTYMLEKIEDGTTLDRLKRYFLNIIEHVVEIPKRKSGNMKHIDVLAKMEILKIACTLGHKKCIEYARQEFIKFQKTGELTDTNYRQIIFCTVMRQSEMIEEDWEILWEAYLTAKTPQEKIAILTSLGCTNNKKILRRFLESTLIIFGPIRQQDMISVFQSVVVNNEGIDVAFQFLIDHLEELQSSFKALNAVQELISRLGERIYTRKQLEAFSKFLEENYDIIDVRVVGKKSFENAKSNYQWNRDHVKSIGEYMDMMASKSTVTYINSYMIWLSITIIILNI